MPRIQNLQALRAYSAVSVAILHIGTVRGVTLLGGAGVSLFFLISGFVMAQVSQTESVPEFVRKRLVRIAPLYWVLTLAAFALAKNGLFLDHAWSHSTSGSYLLKSLLFFPANPILFVGWTLVLEVVFYGVVALGIFFAGNKAPLFAGAVVPLVVCWATLAHGPTLYQQSIIFAFVVGVCFYYVYRHLPTHLSPIATRLLLLLAALCVPWLVFAEHRGDHIAGAHSNFWVVPPVILLMMSALTLARAGWDLRLKSIIILGDASYMLYLLHPFLETAFRLLTERFVPTLAPRASVMGAFSSLLIAIFVSVGVHLYIEKPFLRWSNAASIALGRKLETLCRRLSTLGALPAIGPTKGKKVYFRQT
jgi:peptidoglycan/LPS O-acetylase OafA/YrhL